MEIEYSTNVRKSDGTEIENCPHQESPLVFIFAYENDFMAYQDLTYNVKLLSNLQHYKSVSFAEIVSYEFFLSLVHCFI